MTDLGTALTWTADIGMFTLNRPLTSCSHRTSFCLASCYNLKFYKIFNHRLSQRDVLNEEAWRGNDVGSLKQALSRKRLQTGRIRLMSRGEAISDEHDLGRLEAILQALPKVLVWMPTRAWRHLELRGKVKEIAERYPNLRLLASIDPSTSAEEWAGLKADGWSTMFFGDDTPSDGQFRCPKTHRHLHGHCAICKAGCFSTKRVDVHLKQH